MAGLIGRSKQELRDQVIARLGRVGYSPRSLGEAQRDVLWWIWARVQATRAMRPLLRGWGIAWTSGGYAELVPSEVPRPGRAQVTVEVEISAVSPGTERAQYLHLPNAAVGMLGRPGYSAAGVVAMVGAGVEGLAVGDRVAVTGAAHASIATVPATSVFAVPPSVSMESAALIQLGIIGWQGLRRAGLGSGDRFCVMGGGLVGAMALRLAVAGGSVPVGVIARSRAKEKVAREGGTPAFLVLGEDDAAIGALGSPVVIEATGDPAAIAVAVAAAGERGRIVLLGSPRGTTEHLDLEEVQRRRLEIIGAHVDTVDSEPALPGTLSGRRQAGEEFIRALGEGRLSVDDLAGPAIDPREAGLFYRRLAGSRDLVGAHFDWARLPVKERVGSGHLLRLPDIAAKGMEADRRPVHPGRRWASNRFSLEDPFAGATGHLRVAMLGCGDIAVHNAGALVRAPNLALVSCYDPTTRLAEDLAGRFGGEVAPSAEALIGRGDVDLVLVSVPHHLHAPLAIQALEHGHHVVVEKPVAHSLEAAVAMARAAQQAGVVLSVCFPQRYEPEVAVARGLIQDGALGELAGVAIRLHLDKTPAYWLGGFSGRSRSDWRASKERAGGGVLIMNLSHHLDLMRHLGGVEAELISALRGTTDEPREVEDAISLSVSFANGALGSVLGTSAMRGTAPEELRAWGRHGQVVVAPRPRVFTLRAVDGVRTARWQTFGHLPVVPARAVYLSRLATAIDQGRPVDIPASDGLAVQALIEAAYRSSESHQSVRPADLLADAVK